MLLCVVPLLLLLLYSVAETEADDPKGNSFIYTSRYIVSHIVQCNALSAVQGTAYDIIQYIDRVI